VTVKPDGHQDKCGPKLKNPNNKKDKEGETVDNVNGSVKEKGGNSKSYTLRRLAIMPIVGRS